MNLSIKDVMCDIKRIEGLGWFISDVDCNRIINRKVRTKRGKTMSKEKVADLTQPRMFNNTLYYPLELDLDECYHNEKMLKGVF
jgi:hypothetical protein